MSSLQELQQILKTLRLTETAKAIPDLIREAETKDASYTTFLY
jgi:hypothetical protein